MKKAERWRLKTISMFLFFELKKTKEVSGNVTKE